TDLPGSSLSGLADGSYQFRAAVTDNAGNRSNTPDTSLIVDYSSHASSSHPFANLADTGHTDTPTPITTDGTFDLSLSGDTDANRSEERRVGKERNGAGWTDLPGSRLSGLADGSQQFRAAVNDNHGNRNNQEA